MRCGLVACDQKGDIFADYLFFAHLLASLGVLSFDHHVQEIVLVGQGFGIVSSVVQTLQGQATNHLFGLLKSNVREDIQTVSDGIH